MKKYDKLEINAAGREVPTIINGEQHIPFKGVGKYIPAGRKHATRIVSCANYPSDGNKTVASLKEALIKSGIKDGMTISTHHHFRNGDLIANQIFDIAHELGVKNLRWYLPPCERKMALPFILPSEVKRPNGPFILPSILLMVPSSRYSINFSWQGKDAEGYQRKFLPPSS